MTEEVKDVHPIQLAGVLLSEVGAISGGLLDSYDNLEGKKVEELSLMELIQVRNLRKFLDCVDSVVAATIQMSSYDSPLRDGLAKSYNNFRECKPEKRFGPKLKRRGQQVDDFAKEVYDEYKGYEALRLPVSVLQDILWHCTATAK